MAPKLCPISCVTTSHSVGPKVETAVPETKLPVEPVVVVWQRVDSQATPTSVPVGQPLNRRVDFLSNVVAVNAGPCALRPLVGPALDQTVTRRVAYRGAACARSSGSLRVRFATSCVSFQ